MTQSSLFAETSSSLPTAIAYIDGGARGNPGPAAYGVLMRSPEGKTQELGKYLGIQTNNFAEYSGLLAALEFALQQNFAGLKVFSDSELLVKQMKGQYRVNSPELRPLYEEARRRVPKLDRFQIQHVLREKNRHADRLANLAMDRGMGRAPAARAEPAAAPAPPPTQTGAMLRGFVKGGVVHVLGGDLPDGIFVKVIPE